MDKRTEQFLSLYLDVHDALERATPALESIVQEHKSKLETPGPAPSDEGAGHSDEKEVLS